MISPFVRQFIWQTTKNRLRVCLCDFVWKRTNCFRCRRQPRFGFRKRKQAYEHIQQHMLQTEMINTSFQTNTSAKKLFCLLGNCVDFKTDFELILLAKLVAKGHRMFFTYVSFKFRLNLPVFSLSKLGRKIFFDNQI